MPPEPEPPEVDVGSGVSVGLGVWLGLGVAVSCESSVSSASSVSFGSGVAMARGRGVARAALLDELSSPDEPPWLSAGSLDMSMSTGLVDPIRAIDQGAAIALARFEVQAPPYALLAKSSIKTLKDLKGKVISVGGPKDITRIYVERMLAPQGLKTGDYDFVYAGATSARAQALLGGAVDAAVLLPPSNFQVQNAGYNDLGLAMQYAPELAFSGTVVNKAWAARDANLVKRVLAAQSKSTDYLYDPQNRAEVVRILVAVSGQKPEDVEKSYDFFNKNNFFDRTGKISRLKLNAVIDTLVGLGDVQTRGNVERFLLPGVAELSD